MRELQRFAGGPESSADRSELRSIKAILRLLEVSCETFIRELRD